MGSKQSIHIIGTGAIGEPLIGLLLDLSQDLGVDEVTFHKNRPLANDRAKISRLMARGAKLAVDVDKYIEFEKLGMLPAYSAQEALEQAAVVIDCTPKGVGLKHKEKWYDHMTSARGFIAQGSETGFGKRYALGINDATLRPGSDRFIQIVSCNTHNLAILIETLGFNTAGPDNLAHGHFLCLRRASDISQEGDFVAAPQVGKHKDARFGTHHAKDAWGLFQTRGQDLNLFSSEIKLNSQYMHSLWFNLRVNRPTSVDELTAVMQDNRFVALTEKTMASTVFSFGRDHGYNGRLLNQTVVSLPTLTVSEDGREITGFCFTPQDGNSLLSSVAAAAWLIDPKMYQARIERMYEHLFDEV